MTIPELLERTSITKDILTVINDLLHDPNYSREDAALDLTEFLKKNGYI